MRILLLYITTSSGHHKASLAIEKALNILSPQSEVLAVNSFNYTNPILEKIISKTYMGIIKRTPEVWEYLYDNPKIVRNTQRLKKTIHKHASRKLKTLLDDFRPDVVATTQAFPCGIVADIKKTYNLKIPLVGVLTDFYPHAYWMYESVDRYVVATEEAKQRFIRDGIPEDRIMILGIPIDIKFSEAKPKSPIKEKLNLDKEKSTILVMGGGQGLGPIKAVVFTLQRVATDIQIIIATGTNARLYKYLNKKAPRFKKRLIPLGYSENIDELMEISDIIITKPGGITASEALAKSLPILIINPIPGQEAKNAQYLIKSGAAIQVEDYADMPALIENLFSMPSKLKAMAQAAERIGKPKSAMDVAKMLIGL